MRDIRDIGYMYKVRGERYIFMRDRNRVRSEDFSRPKFVLFPLGSFLNQ